MLSNSLFDGISFMLQDDFKTLTWAWGSDMVTWVKFADAANGIYTVPNACVRWRSSGQNISTEVRPDTICRKLQSVINYMRWILHFSQDVVMAILSSTQNLPSERFYVIDQL